MFLMIFAGSVEGLCLQLPALMEVVVTENRKELSGSTGFNLFVGAFSLHGTFPTESEFLSLTWLYTM